jgi:hypothetical protein
LEETSQQANQQTMEELVKEMAILFKKQQMGKMKSSQMAKVGYYTILCTISMMMTIQKFNFSYL